VEARGRGPRGFAPVSSGHRFPKEAESPSPVSLRALGATRGGVLRPLWLRGGPHPLLERLRLFPWCLPEAVPHRICAYKPRQFPHGDWILGGARGLCREQYPLSFLVPLGDHPLGHSLDQLVRHPRVTSDTAAYLLWMVNDARPVDGLARPALRLLAHILQAGSAGRRTSLRDGACRCRKGALLPDWGKTRRLREIFSLKQQQRMSQQPLTQPIFAHTHGAALDSMPSLWLPHMRAKCSRPVADCQRGVKHQVHEGVGRSHCSQS